MKIKTSMQAFSLTTLKIALCTLKIGVTNRIRTGTNAFTGRDAAVTS